MMYILLCFVPFILFVIELFLHFDSTGSHAGADYEVNYAGILALALYMIRFLIYFSFEPGKVSSLLHPFGTFMLYAIAAKSRMVLTIARCKGKFTK